MLADDINKEWEEFRKILKEIRKRYKERRRAQDLEAKVNNLVNLQNQVATAIKAIQKGTTNKLIKPAKVPVWSKGMQLTHFIKSLEVWIENNKDLPEHSKYNEILESLKLNKEIEGLSLYIGEHIVGKLDTVEKQTVKGLIELLKTKYGRTRQEELEELMMEWLKFDFNEYEGEEDYLLAQEKLIAVMTS